MEPTAIIFVQTFGVVYVFVSFNVETSFGKSDIDTLEMESNVCIQFYTRLSENFHLHILNRKKVY